MKNQFVMKKKINGSVQSVYPATHAEITICSDGETVESKINRLLNLDGDEPIVNRISLAMKQVNLLSGIEDTNVVLNGTFDNFEKEFDLIDNKIKILNGYKNHIVDASFKYLNGVLSISAYGINFVPGEIYKPFLCINGKTFIGQNSITVANNGTLEYTDIAITDPRYFLNREASIGVIKGSDVYSTDIYIKVSIDPIVNIDISYTAEKGVFRANSMNLLHNTCYYYEVIDKANSTDPLILQFNTDANGVKILLINNFPKRFDGKTLIIKLKDFENTVIHSQEV